jgi:hypothetical protein
LTGPDPIGPGEASNRHLGYDATLVFDQHAGLGRTCIRLREGQQRSNQGNGSEGWT